MSPKDLEHQKAKTDRNNSNFVYLKQIKKICKETIPQAQTDPDFDTSKKGKNDSRFSDINESLLYKYLEPQKQAIIKNFLDKGIFELVNFFLVFF